jgi:kumamolisin
MSGKVILEGSYKEYLSDAEDLSPDLGNWHHTITLSLRGGAPIEETAAGVRYGISSEDVEVIERWAAKNNFSVDSINVEAKTIKISGKLSCLAESFDVHVKTASAITGHTIFARGGSISVDEELDGIVRGVFGFDQRPIAKPHSRIHPMGSAAPVSYTPKQVAKAYNFPTNLTGAGQTVAILELGGGYNESDLTRYWSLIGVPPVSVTAVGVDGQANTPSGDPNSADGEVCLDIDVVGGIAPGAKIAVYFAPNTDQGFLDGINAVIYDKVRKPKVLSISWGSAEANWQPQTMLAFNTAFQDAQGLGITVCVASGDNGADDGVGDGKNHVDFPASSPWVLACGGTSLQVNYNGVISSEVVWNNGANGGSSGGGVSNQFTRPLYYQGKIGAPGTGRAVPDVAGNADPDTGWIVIVDGQQTVIGGTSAVAPMWAALIALCNQATKEPAGWIGKVLYLSAPKGTFRDITEGNNGVPGLTQGYPAGVGYDCCTGLGSPNGTNLAALLQRHRGAK